MRRHWPLVTVLAFGLSIIGANLAPPAYAVTYFQGHCKDAAHLQTVHTPPGATLLAAADVSVTVDQATDTMQCINDTAYRGPIYTINIPGKTLHMEPDGALEVENTFYYYWYYQQTPELQHTDNMQFFTFADFSHDASAVVWYSLYLDGA